MAPPRRRASPLSPPAPPPPGQTPDSAPAAGADAGRSGAATGIAVAATIVLWATSFAGARFVLRHYDPATLTLLRLLCASLVLGLYATAVRLPLPAWRDWPIFLAFGLVGVGGGNLTLILGLRSVSAGAGSFLVGTIPIFSILLARAFFGERLAGRGWLGIGVSFAGMALIALGEGQGLRVNPGAGLVVLSALCQSVYYVFQRPYLARYSALRITCYSVWCATLWLTPFAWGLPAALRAAPASATAVGAYLGVFPLAIALVLWLFALGRATTAQVTSALYAMPALALLIAYLWLGEIPGALSLAGGLLALGGVALLHLWRK